MGREHVQEERCLGKDSRLVDHLQREGSFLHPGHNIGRSGSHERWVSEPVSGSGSFDDPSTPAAGGGPTPLDPEGYVHALFAVTRPGWHHRNKSSFGPNFPGGGFPPGQQLQASPNSTATSRCLLFYSKDILSMNDEDVGNMRWVGFLTLVDPQGGQYRLRSSAPTAYGGFSDIWQCDARFLNGSSEVVSRGALFEAADAI